MARKPGLLSERTSLAPCKSAIALAKLSPRPELDVDLLFSSWKRGDGTLCSVHWREFPARCRQLSTLTPAFGARSPRLIMVCGGQCLMAFSTRFAHNCASRLRSPSISHAPPSIDKVIVIAASAATSG